MSLLCTMCDTPLQQVQGYCGNATEALLVVAVPYIVHGAPAHGAARVQHENIDPLYAEGH